MSFAQGAPTQPLVLQGSNVFLYGSSTTGNAFTVQQQSAGNVASFVTSTGATGLIVNPTGLVGIGKTNPAYALDVTGDLNFTGTFRQNGTPYIGSQWTGTSTLYFVGNVGINTTSVANPLTVGGSTVISTAFGSTATSTTLNLSDSATRNLSFILNATAGTYNQITAAGDTLLWYGGNAQNTGVITIAPWNSGYLGLRLGTSSNTCTIYSNVTSFVSNTNSTAMTIVNGNVGIGTTNPTKLLQVWGGMIIGASSDSRATTVTLNAPGATTTFSQNADIGDGARIMCLQCPDLSSTTANLVSFSLQVAPTGTFGTQRTSLDLKGFRVASQSYGGFCITSPFDSAGSYDLFYADRTKAYFQQSVGIGTGTNLASPLVVYNPSSTSTYTGTTAWGNIHLMPQGTNNSWAGITFGGSSGGTIQQSTQASITVDSNSTVGTNMRFNVGYLFANGATERLTILGQTGYVGIGTTNPGSYVDVFTPNLGSTAGNTTANALRLSWNSAGNNNSYLSIYGYRTSTGSLWTTMSTRIMQTIDVTNQGYIEFNGTNNNSGVGMYGSSGNGILVSSGGNVGIGTTNPSSYTLQVAGTIGASGDITALYSDERLKTKTGTLTGALDKVCSLDTFTYRNNELAQSFGVKDDYQRVGVSAQQVQKVLPEAVRPAPFDAENQSGQNYLTVQYEKLVPLLIEALKEERCLRCRLEERVAALESASDRAGKATASSV